MIFCIYDPAVDLVGIYSVPDPTGPRPALGGGRPLPDGSIYLGYVEKPRSLLPLYCLEPEGEDRMMEILPEVAPLCRSLQTLSN